MLHMWSGAGIVKVRALRSKRALNLDEMQLRFICKELTNEFGCHTPTTGTAGGKKSECERMRGVTVRGPLTLPVEVLKLNKYSDLLDRVNLCPFVLQSGRGIGTSALDFLNTLRKRLAACPAERNSWRCTIVRSSSIRQVAAQSDLQ